MFNKIRYSYHLTACERMIKKRECANPIYEWHKRKLHELMTKINNK